MSVFVLDKRGKPLMPCSEKRARLLLERGRARVHRLKPFVIRLVDRTAEDSVFQPIEVKIDPGSKHTGMAVVRKEEASKTVHALSLFELKHRGESIHRGMLRRALLRRGRRTRKTRYRPSRFLNRPKPKGWLAPSLMHRVLTTQTWVKRFARWAPVTGLVLEDCRFDTQRLQNLELKRKACQRGDLWDCEVREYVFAKWGYRCIYCDRSAFDGDGCILELDHLHPRSKGGSDRASNRGPACIRCNRRKGNMLLKEFLAHDPVRYARIVVQMRAPLKDAAAMNAVRYRLRKALRCFQLPLELASGGRTKWNRQQFGIPKTHALDAACVGEVNRLVDWKKPTHVVECRGRGRYSRTMVTKDGFPRAYCGRKKRWFGFSTGDLVSLKETELKNTPRRNGVWKPASRFHRILRVTVRARGAFTVVIAKSSYDLPWHRFTLRQRHDGYAHRPLSVNGVSP